MKLAVRQLSPSTNLVLAILAGLGLLGSLSLPWFATPVVDATGTDGPVERAAFQVSQVFSTAAKATTSGSGALGGAQAFVVALVGLLALNVLAISTPAIRRQAEDLMRVLVLAAPVILVAAAFAHPGTTSPVSLHYGMLISFVLTAVMCSAAWHGANMREKRAAPVRPRYGA